MNILSLVTGIALVILSVMYFLYVWKRAKRDKDYDLMSYSFDINIVAGIFAFFAAGITLIYRGLRNFF